VKDKSVSSPIVVRRKPQQVTIESRKDKCISSIETSNIPSDNEDTKKQAKIISHVTTANQPLPNTDPRRKTIHGSDYATPDELMQQVSQDEQRRKASYNLLKSSVGGSGMDTLYRSGSGITRVSTTFLLYFII
jgi:hypothetical protein